MPDGGDQRIWEEIQTEFIIRPQGAGREAPALAPERSARLAGVASAVDASSTEAPPLSEAEVAEAARKAARKAALPAVRALVP